MKLKTMATVTLLLPAICGASWALSAEPSRSTEQTVMHHMQMVSSGNVDAILGDYADDAFIIDSRGVTRGKQAIRKIFEQMMGRRPPGRSGPLPPGKQVFEGDVGFLVMSGAPGGPGILSESYVVRDGLIHAQIVTPAPSAETGK